MDDTNKEHVHGDNCCGCQGRACGMWCSHGHGHFLLRWLLGVLIILMVFWLGFKLGEFKGYFEGNGFDSYHAPRMMYYGNTPYGGYRMMGTQGGVLSVPPMMQNQSQSGSAQPQQ